jgi:hypothetical protein
MFRDVPHLTYDDLITGEKFVGICDAVWFHYQHTAFNPTVGMSRFFYADTYRAEELFERLAAFDAPEVVAVTHNADREVDASMMDCLPANVVAWFSQNVCHVHPKLHPLPIGLENERWFPELRKKQKILDYRAAPVTPTRLLYMNHAIATNPAARQPPYDLFRRAHWCTAVRGRNGHDFDGYLRHIADHFYVLSPEGNGIDCHRTWEALYMNRVPILIRNANTAIYEDLPVLLVDRWSEINERCLREKMGQFLEGRYDFEKLRFSFWRQRIRSLGGDSRGGRP